MALRLLSLVLLAQVSHVRGHAVLANPVPRGGPVKGNGPKITPFAATKTVVNGLDGGSGCGGTKNNEKPAGLPRVAYAPGSIITVEWDITIPHDPDRLDSGVRIALNFSATDSFSKNVLAGILDGETGTNIDAGGNTPTKRKIWQGRLPAGKTCQCCTLQWLWAAKRDGGFYVGCADIAITADAKVPRSCEVAASGGDTGSDKSGSGGDKVGDEENNNENAKAIDPPVGLVASDAVAIDVRIAFLSIALSVLGACSLAGTH